MHSFTFSLLKAKGSRQTVQRLRHSPHTTHCIRRGRDAWVLQTRVCPAKFKLPLQLGKQSRGRAGESQELPQVSETPLQEQEHTLKFYLGNHQLLTESLQEKQWCPRAHRSTGCTTCWTHLLMPRSRAKAAKNSQNHPKKYLLRVFRAGFKIRGNQREVKWIPPDPSELASPDSAQLRDNAVSAAAANPCFK